METRNLILKKVRTTYTGRMWFAWIPKSGENDELLHGYVGQKFKTEKAALEWMEKNKGRIAF